MSNLSLYQVTVPHFVKTLQNLSALLEKGAARAEAKKFEMEVLLQSRLAPDQFNLIRQVQISCDTAKLAVSRVSGKEAPKNDDTEKTASELKARIAQTIQYLNSVTEQDFAGAADKKITHARWEDKYMTGHDFIFHHVLPNLYFHVTTAYSILRHNGVEIGKKDYLGELPFKK